MPEAQPLHRLPSISWSARRAYIVGLALIATSLVAALLIAGVVALALWQQRSDAWLRSLRNAENLRTVLAQDISNRFRAVDSVLNELAANIADDRIPASVTPSLVLRAAAADGYIDSILVLDSQGTITADGRIPPRRGNFAERDFFEIQKEIPHYGIYISHPYEIRPGVPVLTFSKRFESPAGTFGGVVAINFRLRYVWDLFSSVDLEAGGVLTLTQVNGYVLARYPAVVPNMSLGVDLAGAPTFQRIRRERMGSFEGTASIDGADRLYAFAPVDGANMFLSIGLSLDSVYAQWTSRARAIGGATLTICVLLAALAFFLWRELRRRTAAEAELAELAVTDALSGLPNRRAFDRFLEREWRRAARTGNFISLLMIDVDHFKAVNDRFGHTRGDRVLRMLAKLISGATQRPEDLAARYGGEEFAVVLPDTAISGGLHVARMIQERLAENAENQGLDGPRITVSIGLASLIPAAGEEATELVASADRALYRAKNEGRNIVRTATPHTAWL